MIELFRLKNEKLETLQHSKSEATKRWLRDVRGTVWVRCVSPDREKIQVLSAISGINMDEFQEVIEEEERARVTVEKYLEVIYHVPATDADGDVETVSLYIYLVNNMVLTIERKTNELLSLLSKQMKNGKRRFLFKNKPGQFLYYLLDNINDIYLKYIDRISGHVDLFSENIQLSTDNIQKIYNSSVTLSYFNQSLIANIEVLNNLRKSYYRGFSPEMRNEFSELYFDALQILDTEKIQRESIANLFNLQAAMSSARLNAFSKRITFLAVVIAIPTMISGLYGMNVMLPFQDSSNAFFLIVGLMFIVALIALVIFRSFDK